MTKIGKNSVNIIMRVNIRCNTLIGVVQKKFLFCGLNCWNKDDVDDGAGHSWVLLQ